MTEQVGPRGASRLRPLLRRLRGTATLRAMRRAPRQRGLLIVAGIAAVIAVGAALGSSEPNSLIGIVGALGIAIPVLVALRDVLAGTLVALVGGAGFVLLVAYAAAPDPLAYGVPVVVVWVAIAAFVGWVAERLREHARRASAETLALHRELAVALVPPGDHRYDGVTVVSAYRPGERRVALGGDFYDVLRGRDGSLSIVIGDVSGHGPAAAAVGAVLRAAWRSLVLADVSVADRFQALSDLLRARAADDLFATLCECRIDLSDDVATITSGGHPLPLLLDGDSRASLDVPPGPPLGLHLDGLRWTSQQVKLPARFALLLYTDGASEARAAPGAVERVGARGLRDAFAIALADGDDPLAALLRAVEQRNGGPLDDDAALVAIVRPPRVVAPAPSRANGRRSAPAAEGLRA